jgi:hypothetical protein
MIALHGFKLTYSPCYNEFNVKRFVFYDVQNKIFFYTLTHGEQAFFESTKDRLGMDMSYNYYKHYIPRWMAMYLTINTLLGEAGKDIFNTIASYYIHL